MRSVKKKEAGEKMLRLADEMLQIDMNGTREVIVFCEVVVGVRCSIKCRFLLVVLIGNLIKLGEIMKIEMYVLWFNFILGLSFITLFGGERGWRGVMGGNV